MSVEARSEPDLTPWQWMSRQANYRQLREAERIKKRWQRLPFFQSTGLISLGFIRKNQHYNGFNEEADGPAFNSGMVTQLHFPSDTTAPVYTDLVRLLFPKGGEGAFRLYLTYIEKTNPVHRSVRQAIDFLRQVIAGDGTRFEVTFQDVFFRQQLHHHLAEVYRRCHYRGVLNTLLYNEFYPSGGSAKPASTILFDTFLKNPDDRLPRFVPLACNGVMREGFPEVEQEDFRFERPFEQSDATWPHLRAVVRNTHQQLWQILEIQAPDKDRLAMAIPIHDLWSEGKPLGTYLGHFLLILDRTQESLAGEQGQHRLRDFSQDQRKEFWSALQKQAIWEAFPRHDAAEDSPRLQWEAMERDLNLFARVVYETEMADWVNYEFNGEVSTASIRHALETAIVRSDGWSIAPEEEREQGVEPSPREEQVYLDPTIGEADYGAFFNCRPLPSDPARRVVWLKLHEGMHYPGDPPRRVLELFLVNDPDTRLPHSSGTPDSTGKKLTDQLLRKLYKRCIDFYQRLLRRADILAAGEQKGSEEMITTVTRTIIHEINGDLNELRTACGYQDLIRALEVWNGYLKFGRTESMGNGVEDFERALTQAKRNAEGIDSLLSMAHFKMKGFYRCIVNEPGKDEKSTKGTLRNLIQTAWVHVLSKPESQLHFENADHPGWDLLLQALEGDLEFAFSVLFRNASQHRNTETIVSVLVDMPSENELVLSWTNQTTPQKLQMLDAYLKGRGSRRHSGMSFARSVVKSKFSSELAYSSDPEKGTVTTSLKLQRNTLESSSLFFDIIF